MLSFNLYFIDQPYTSHELPPLVSSCHIISHNLLSDEHVWAHSCCLTPPPQEKNKWFKRSHTSRSSIRSRWRLPVHFLAPRMDFRSCYIYLLFFVRLPLCNNYSDYCDIYLYTLCYYICCLLWRMYEMHPALSLKARGVTIPSEGRIH